MPMAMLLLSLGGFLAICAGRDRHQRDLLGRRLDPATGPALRWLGVLMIAVALPLGWWILGFGYGTVTWIGLAGLCALATMLALTLITARRQRSRA